MPLKRVRCLKLELLWIVLAALAAGPARAQIEGTVTTTGCEGPAFDTGCSLAELLSIGGNGQTGSIAIEIMREVDLPVVVVFDRFVATTVAFGTPETDFNGIEVALWRHVFNGVQLRLIDRITGVGREEWRVVGDADGISNAKTDVINYRVRALDPATLEPSPRRLTSVGVYLDEGAPRASEGFVRMDVYDSITGSGVFIFLQDGLAQGFPSGNEIRGGDGIRPHQPVSELTVVKEVRLDAADREANLAEIDRIVQMHTVTFDREPVCNPAITDNEEIVRIICDPREGQTIPLGVGAEPRFVGTGVEFGTVSPTGNDKSWNIVGPPDPPPSEPPAEPPPDWFGAVWPLDDLFPTVEGLNFNLLGGFSSDGGQLVFGETTQSLVTGALIGQTAQVLGLVSGEAATILETGDSIDRGAEGVFVVQRILEVDMGTDGRVYLTAELATPAAAVVQAIVTVDTSSMVDDGTVPIVGVLLPGDTVPTPTGPQQIDNPNILYVSGTTDFVLWASFAGQSSTLLRGPPVADADNVVLSRSGDPLSGNDDSFLYAMSTEGGLNGVGDAAFIGTRQTFSPGAPQQFDSCVFLVPADANSIEPLACTGDSPLVLILNVGLFDIGGVISAATIDPGDGSFDVGLFEFSTPGAALESLLGAGEPLTIGPETREIAEVRLDAHGARSDGAVTVAVRFADASESVVILAPTPVVPFVTVPDLLGVARDDVAAFLAPADLTVGDITTVSSDLPRDRVASQAPAAGALVPAGTAVSVAISVGPAFVVPDVVGMDQGAAEAAIVTAQLFVGQVTMQSSDSVPAGAVIATSPMAGVIPEFGPYVDLVVSSGPQQVIVPLVLNFPEEAAVADLVAAGFTVIIERIVRTDVEPGIVEFQLPSAGQLVAAGTAVRLQVSAEPDRVTVPNVVGQLDFVVGPILFANDLVGGTATRVTSLGAPLYTVLEQSPVAGTDVAEGSTVDYVIVVPAGDIDGDRDIDVDDINAILAARNQPAAGSNDPRDMNGDGRITVNDARAARVSCTRPGCARQ